MSIPAGKMHADEVDIDAQLVRRLLAAQFPQWADHPVTPVVSAGTDNALYRLGDDLVVRLPRIYWAVNQIDREFRWLPRLAPYLPLALPAPLAKGRPGAGYPYSWGVYRWLAGESATIESIADPIEAALDLAHFITALQRIDTAGGPRPGQHNLSRGKPLTMRDRATREAIAALGNRVDAGAAMAVWEGALKASEWSREPVWFHGDLLAGNLLCAEGRIHAVIDFGALAVGDPACDLMIAWDLFEGDSRDAFRTALLADDATWERGRGWALSQALIFVPYYLETNPAGVTEALRRIDLVLADQSAGL